MLSTALIPFLSDSPNKVSHIDRGFDAIGAVSPQRPRGLTSNSNTQGEDRPKSDLAALFTSANVPPVNSKSKHHPSIDQKLARNSNRQQYLASRRYRVIGQLGTGGYGEVFGVFDRLKRKKVALKTCLAPQGTKEYQAFVQEFRLARAISHPLWINAFEFGYSSDDSAYYTMEWIKGQPLSALVPLPSLESLAGLIGLLSRGLGFIHRFGLVHSDLKPSNIMVCGAVENSQFNLPLRLKSENFSTKDDSGTFAKEWTIKFMDPGLMIRSHQKMDALQAEKLDTEKPHQFRGTVDYMAPEVITGEQIDGRTDLYALGVILYELITGKTPFAADDVLMVVSGHLEKEPIPAKMLRPELPDWIDCLVQQLLKKDRACRPASTAEVIEATEVNAANENSYSLQNKVKNGYGEENLVSTASTAIALLLRDKEFPSADLKTSTIGTQLLIPSRKNSLALSAMEDFLSTTSHSGSTGYPARLFTIRDRDNVGEIWRFDCLTAETKEFSSRVTAYQRWLKDRQSRSAKEAWQTFLQSAGQDQANAPVLIVPEKPFPWGESPQVFEQVISIPTLTKSDIAKLLSYLLQLPVTSPPIESPDQSKSAIATLSEIEQASQKLWDQTGGNEEYILWQLLAWEKARILTYKNSVWHINLTSQMRSHQARMIKRHLLQTICLLDERSCLFLRVAAVHGRIFNLEIVADVLSYSRNEAQISCELLLNSGIIQLEPGTDNNLTYLKFCNPALRVALDESVPTGLKRSWHGKIGKHLEAKAILTPIRDYGSPANGEVNYSESGSKEKPSVFELAELTDHFLLSDLPESGVRYALRYAEVCATENRNGDARCYLQKGQRKCRFIRDKAVRLKLHSQVLMQEGDLCKGIGYFKQAENNYLILEHLCQLTGDHELLAETYKDLGDLYRLNNRFEEGQKAIKQAIGWFEKTGNRAEISHAHNNLGNILWRQGVIPAALEHYTSALEIQEELGLSADAASTLNNMGSAYLHSQRYLNALSHYQKSLGIMQQLGKTDEIARAMNNIGFTLTVLGKFQSAKEYLSKSLSLNRVLGKKAEVINTLSNCAWLALHQGEPDQLFDCGQEAIQQALEMSDLQLVAETSLILAEQYLRMGHYQKVWELLQIPGIDSLDTFTSGPVQRADLRARFYLEQGDRVNAGQAIREVKAIGESSSDLRVQVMAEITRIRFALADGSPTAVIDERLAQAKPLIEKFEGLFEKSLFSLLQIQHSLRTGDLTCIESEEDRLDKLLPECYSIVLYTFRLGLKGQLAILQKNYELAQSLFAEAIQYAQQVRWQIYVWRLRTELGKVAVALGNPEKAFYEFRAAYEIVRNISTSLSDPGYLTGFMDDPLKIALCDNVHRLALQLVP